MRHNLDDISQATKRCRLDKTLFRPKVMNIILVDAGRVLRGRVLFVCAAQYGHESIDGTMVGR